MKDIINKFLDFLTEEKKYSDYTEKNYELDLAKYEQFLGGKNYKTIKYQDINEYVIYLKKSGYKPTSINRNLSALRSFYNFLVMNKKVKNNPFDLVSSVKTEKRLPNYFKYEDFLSMIDSLDDNHLNIRNKLILELLFATGIRVSELANIKLVNLDINSKELKVMGKGKKERIVFFGPSAQTAIKDYMKNSRGILLNGKQSDYLLLNHLGNKLTDRGIRLIIENIIKRCAISAKISPHTFRHTFATIMLSNGCNIKSVQELLGHVSLNTTSIYTHLTNDELRNTYLKSHPRAKK